jgi:hypothetical protein
VTTHNSPLCDADDDRALLPKFSHPGHQRGGAAPPVTEPHQGAAQRAVWLAGVASFLNSFVFIIYGICVSATTPWARDWGLRLEIDPRQHVHVLDLLFYPFVPASGGGLVLGFMSILSRLPLTFAWHLAFLLVSQELMVQSAHFCEVVEEGGDVRSLYQVPAPLKRLAVLTHVYPPSLCIGRPTSRWSTG